MDIVLVGPRRNIVAFVRRDGGAPANEFLATLDEVGFARYARNFLMLTQHGRLDGKAFHPLDEKKSRLARHLSEFKDNGTKTRILCFNDGDLGALVLTHGFQKKENQLDPGEMKRAHAIRDEYFSRRDELVAAFTVNPPKGGRK